MENILVFLENNYIWFLVAAAILLLALIGLIVDSKRKQKKMEGKLDTLDKVETAPVAEVSAMPNVEPTVQADTTKTPQPEPAEPVMPQMDTVQEPVNTFTPVVESVEQKVETFNFEPAVNSNNMTFNDVPTPSTSFEMPVAEPVTQKDEIIEPFNIGNPVVMNEAQPLETVEPINNETPVKPLEQFQTAQPFAPAEEPIIKINE